MTIWVLAFLLITALSLLGWRQGVIRVGFSFIGILIAALLAGPLARLVKPILVMVGVKSTILLGVLAPLIGFAFVLTIFKVAGFSVYQKVDVYFKYKAGDLRIALWERLNHRLGLCLGIFNGVLYFVLLSWGIYALSYWTVQAGTPDNQPTTLKIMNRLGNDLDKSGFSRVARSIDRFPKEYYDTADIVGLIYSNPLLEARVSRYPGFLSIAEKPEFQDIASDNQFTEMRQQHKPIIDLINYPKTQAILKNPELMKQIRGVLIPDLADLRTFLETGRSAKYDAQQILGRWQFDLNYTVFMIHRAKPNLSASEMQKQKKQMSAAFSKSGLVATTEHEVFLKNVPKVVAGATSGAEVQNVAGTWEGDGGKYIVSFKNGKGDVTANVEGDRLSLKGDGLELAFTRED
jgi:hypothetical protein